MNPREQCCHNPACWAYGRAGEGHIVVHTTPAEGLCVVDVVARAPADVRKGVEVITRRLGVPAETA